MWGGRHNTCVRTPVQDADVDGPVWDSEKHSEEEKEEVGRFIRVTMMIVKVGGGR